MKNQFSGNGVSIILARPVGGEREHKFKTGAELADWCWKNAIHIFPQEKQRNEKR